MLDTPLMKKSVDNALEYCAVPRRSARAPRPMVLLACLLIGIRLIAGAVSEACFFDLEVPSTRTVHIHSAGDHDHCSHGRYNVPPLLAWACSACKDANEFALPETPPLQILVSFFVPLFLLLLLVGSRPLIAARGRGPPLLSH